VSDSNADDIAHTSAALVAAIAEAKVRLAREELGEDFPELLRHARELYESLRETLIEDPAGGEYTRGLLESIGNNLDQIEAAARAGYN
jgi:hypothetical protein